MLCVPKQQQRLEQLMAWNQGDAGAGNSFRPCLAGIRCCHSGCWW